MSARKISHCGVGNFPANSITEFGEVMGFPVVPRTRRKHRIKSLLPRPVRLNTNVFAERGAETTQGLNQFFASSDIPDVEGDKHKHLLAVDFPRKKW